MPAALSSHGDCPLGRTETKHRQTRRGVSRWVLHLMSLPEFVKSGTIRPLGEGLVSTDSIPKSKQHVVLFRVRYSETDQMGTFYNSRALEWFECGRTELLRAMGIPYAEMEIRGVMLPLIEAHVEYLGRARYDDLLKMTTRAALAGKARLRFDVEIAHAEGNPAAEPGRPVARGYTIHAITDGAGKPARPPAWLLQKLSENRP